MTGFVFFSIIRFFQLKKKKDKKCKFSFSIVDQKSYEISWGPLIKLSSAYKGFVTKYGSRGCSQETQVKMWNYVVIAYDTDPFQHHVNYASNPEKLF